MSELLNYFLDFFKNKFLLSKITNVKTDVIGPQGWVGNWLVLTITVFF